MGHKMANKIATQSLWIGIFATIIDQLYHIARGFTHQVFHLLDENLSSETAYYIGLKFLFIFIVSFIVLKTVKGTVIHLSLIISVVAAALFSIVLTYMFPGVYGLQMDMLHGAGIFLATYITLKLKLGGN